MREAISGRRGAFIPQIQRFGRQAIPETGQVSLSAPLPMERQPQRLLQRPCNPQKTKSVNVFSKSFHCPKSLKIFIENFH
jgi:hypothetical protein